MLSKLLSTVRLEEPLETEFRIDFDQQGRDSRLELWIILVVSVSAVLILNRTLLKVPAEVLPLGRQLLFGVMVPVLLRWLSSAWSPLHRWSAPLYILAVFIDIGCLMVLRIACLNHGYDTVPLIIPVALLLSLVVVQIRILLLAPMVVLGLTGIIGAELWAFEADSNRMFQLAAAAILALVALSPAYELERWARIAWLRQRGLTELARTDALTGLPNRRHFDAVLRQTIRLAAREGRSVALLILDIDHFKSYNDHYGHPAGDTCLRTVARHLGRSMRRPQDLAARLGGEEFAAIWYDAAPGDAGHLAETLRGGIAGLGIAAAPGWGERVTASAGFVQIVAPRPEEAAEQIAVEMMRRADAALYRAKREGRDRMAVADSSLPRLDHPPRESGHPVGYATDDPPAPTRSGRMARLLDGVSFAEPLESEFHRHFEQQGRSSRSQILIGLILVCFFLLSFDRTLLKIPEPARLLGQLTLILGLIPAALVGLLGCFWTRLQPWSAPIYVGTVAVILLAQMLQRLVQLPNGYDVVPLLMPLSVLLSLSVVQIRFSLLAPSLAVLTVGVLGMELGAFDLDSRRLLEAGAFVVMVLVTLSFSYKVERSARLGWRRERRLDEMARTDGLTGLANRLHFDSTLRQRIRSAARERRGVALAILDIDHFKSYNDHYGHPAGDACLVAVGGRLRERMRRPLDFAARLGGEEFAAVWFDASAHDAPRLAEDLLRGIEALAIAPAPGHGDRVTASAGLVQVLAPPPEVDTDEIAERMLREADAALYRAKRGGRNRLVVAGTEAPSRRPALTLPG